MRSTLVLVVLLAVLAGGCDKKEKEQLQGQVTQLQSENQQLQSTLKEREQYLDEVMKGVNAVYADLETARAKEAKLMKRTGGSEGPVQISDTDARQKLLQNISDIDSALKENRKRIAGLQTKVKSLRGDVGELKTLVDNLKKSLEEREQSIAQLEERVKGLETTVAEKTQIIAAKDDMILSQQKMMDKVFYVIGTKSELKEKGVIQDEGGFPWGLFGSTTVLAPTADASLFTPIDRTSDETIPIKGEIEDILPHRTTDSFDMSIKGEKESALKIVRPEKFWQEKYLVIVVD
jgi:predicted  nucleic acid-binding Zn-ribbon protein